MRRAAALFALLLMLPAPAAAQKHAFVDALIAFHSALPGTYGDEGSRVLAHIEQMASSLDAWEESSRAAEGDLKARAGTAPADLALHYLDQGQLAAAIEAMTSAVLAEPRRAALHLFLGLMHDAAGHAGEAASAFRTAFELDPASPVHAYLVGARRAPDAGDETLAPIVAAMMSAESTRRTASFIQLALIDDKTAGTPVFAPAAYAAGFASIAEGRYRQAIDQFRTAASRDPLVVDPAGRAERILQGIQALKEKRGDAAIEHLEAAVAALPASAEARRVLGIAYRANGRLPQSVAHFEAAVALAPRDERARVSLATTLAEAGNLPEAERVLRETIEMLPASGEARWALADVHEKLGRGLDAMATLESATPLTVLAGKAALYWRIADLAHRHQDYPRVIEMLSSRVRLLPNDALAHRDLGMAHTRVGRNDEALIELLMAAILGQQDAGMLAAIGQIHLNAGRLEAADGVLRRAIALDPRLPQARYALGSTLQRLGRAQEAKQQLDEFQRLRAAALQEQRRSFEIETLMHEGDLLVRDGKLEAAIAPYEKAAALGGPADIYRQLADIFEKLGRAADRANALAAYEERLQKERR
jgi:tetratricopeptide (TPR) repeat protein